MLDVALAFTTSVAGLAGIFKTTKAFFDYYNERKKIEYIDISISDDSGNHIKIPIDTPAEDIEKLIGKIRANQNDIKVVIERLREDTEELTKQHHVDNHIAEKNNNATNFIKNEDGFVLSELFLYFVPGVIALLFSGTFLYLIIKNQKIPNYTAPKELSSAMTMIIGYFFGVGAASASNKGRVLTQDEIKKIIQS